MLGVTENNTPTLQENIQTLKTKMHLMTYAVADQNYLAASAAGIHLFHVNGNIMGDDSGFTQAFRPDKNTFNPTALYNEMDTILKQDPSAQFVVRLTIAAPDWWLKENPQHADLNYDYSIGGTLQKKSTGILSSPFLRSTLKNEFQNLLNDIKQNGRIKRIRGFILLGLQTQEWYPYDAGTSLTMLGKDAWTLQAFREWVQKKYVSEENLKTAWGNGGISFSNIRTPSDERRRAADNQNTFRQLPRDQDLIDFYSFYNQLIPSFVNEMASVVKTNSFAKEIPVGFIYGYMNEFRGDETFGHNALGLALREPNIDFILTEASQVFRDWATGADLERGPFLSAALNGKFIMYDNDQYMPGTKQRYIELCEGYRGSLSDADFYQQFPQCKPEYIDYIFRLSGSHNVYRENVNETFSIYKRYLGFTLSSGVAYSLFPFYGKEIDYSPGLWSLLGELRKAYESARSLFLTNTLSKTDSSAAEVLVISDEASTFFVNQQISTSEQVALGAQWGPTNHLLNRNLSLTRLSLRQMGAPYDHILMSDIEKVNPAQYKVIIFLNAFSLSTNQITFIREKFQNNGRTILWNHLAGYATDGKISAANTDNLVGFHIVTSAPKQSSEHGFQISNFHPIAQKILSNSLYQFSSNPADVLNMGNLYPYAADGSASILSYYPGTLFTNMAIKDFGIYKSIWASDANFSSVIYREILRDAGVHIYNEKSDTTYVSQKTFTLHAINDGSRFLKFPKPIRIYDLMSDQELTSGLPVMEFQTPLLKKGETINYRLDSL
ncbi:MAG: beta-galactosidase [Deltaproteobacteria bacterium]|nr:beta-galactosidase [Deltaproteobacteria bacterium]